MGTALPGGLCFSFFLLCLSAFPDFPSISCKMKQTLPCQVAFCGGVCHRALTASARTDLTDCASGFSLLSRCLKEELAYSLSIFLVTFESGFSRDWQSLEGRIGP